MPRLAYDSNQDVLFSDSLPDFESRIETQDGVWEVTGATEYGLLWSIFRNPNTDAIPIANVKQMILAYVKVQ